jgi:hypothetical protein
MACSLNLSSKTLITTSTIEPQVTETYELLALLAEANIQIHKGMPSNAPALVNRVTKIQDVIEGGIVDRMLYLFCDMYLKLDKESKCSVQQFLSKHLTENNVGYFLDVSKGKQATELVGICYRRIEENFNIKISTIEEMKVYIKNNGKYLLTLDLTFLENQVDDDFIEFILPFCENLNEVTITSINFYGQGFKNLHLLTSLKILKLKCRNLTLLNNLPENLETLKIVNSKRLSSVKLPPHLKVFSLYNCSYFYRIPHLPDSLIEFVAFNCTTFRLFSNLPKNLKKLFIPESQSLESLPLLPPHLEQLYIFGCRKLSTLPPIPKSLYSIQLENCIKLTFELRKNLFLKVLREDLYQALILFKGFELEHNFISSGSIECIKTKKEFLYIKEMIQTKIEEEKNQHYLTLAKTKIIDNFLRKFIAD